MLHENLLLLAASTTTTASKGAGFSFSMSPNLSAPGAAGLQQLINTILFYALIACGIGALGGVAAWAGAKAAHMDHVSSKGKEGLFVAVGCAFLVGALASILNFAYSIG
jgi:hypothetical protein